MRILLLFITRGFFAALGRLFGAQAEFVIALGFRLRFRLCGSQIRQMQEQTSQKGGADRADASHGALGRLADIAGERTAGTGFGTAARTGQVTGSLAEFARDDLRALDPPLSGNGIEIAIPAGARNVNPARMVGDSRKDSERLVSCQGLLLS